MESIYLKFIDNQAVKIQWCTCTPKIHKNDKNTTSPYKWKIFLWYQVRFVNNEIPDSKPRNTKAYLGYYSMFYRCHM